MNNTHKTIAAIAVGAAVATKAYTVIVRNVTLARFPDLDPKIAKQAYKVMMRASFGGTVDANSLTEEQMDAKFLEIVAQLTSTK